MSSRRMWQQLLKYEEIYRGAHIKSHFPSTLKRMGQNKRRASQIQSVYSRAQYESEGNPKTNSETAINPPDFQYHWQINLRDVLCGVYASPDTGHAEVSGFAPKLLI